MQERRSSRGRREAALLNRRPGTMFLVPPVVVCGKNCLTNTLNKGNSVFASCSGSRQSLLLQTRFEHIKVRQKHPDMFTSLCPYDQKKFLLWFRVALDDQSDQGGVWK